MLWVRMKATLVRSVLCAVVCLDALSSQAMGQPIINEVMAARQTLIVDDDNDNSDWLELLNAGSQRVELWEYGLSDRLTGREPWRFPPVGLEPGEYLLVWCSGKDRTSPSVEFSTAADSPLPFTPSLVTLDDTWRYLATDDAMAPFPADWEQPEFDDGGWPEGRPGFGFADDDDVTVVPSETISILLRRTFTVADPGRLPSLLLRVDYDDAFVAYLNGVRVLSVNFPPDEEPSGAVRARGVRESGKPQRFDVSTYLDVLRNGPNVLAIVVLNSTPGRGDLSMIPELGSVPPVFHADFKLSSGETVVLTDPGGGVVDAVPLGRQVAHRSFGRSPDASSELRYHFLPTPLESNRLPVATSPPEPVGPIFSPPGGRFAGPLTVSLAVELEFSGWEVRYTLDGTTPSVDSLAYEGPLAVMEDTVLRATVFFDGRPMAPAVTQSYFGISETSRQFALPTVSIAMPPEDFHLVQNNALGRGRRSEREAHLEIFDVSGDAVLATGFGLRLAGRSSRNGDFEFKKAYRAYFRSVYGVGRLRFPLFPDTTVDSFDQIALRPSHSDRFRQDINGTLVRDQVMRDLQEDMGGIVSHGTWYNLLVNMKYLGVYNVMERINEEFFESHRPESGSQWDVLNGDGPINGTADAWRDFLSFMRTGDFRDDAMFDRALERIDVDNFTSYMILNMWAQNHDWPGNNYVIGRSRRDDGRWVFLSWDAEFAMAGGRWGPKGFDADTFALVMSNTGGFASVFKGLLENAAYRDYFLREVDRQLATNLSPDHVLERIRRQGDVVEPDIPEEAALTDETLETWQRNMTLMEEFVRRRGPFFAQFVRSDARFGLQRFPRGDVDTDGRVNVLDAVLVLRYLTGQAEFAGCLDRLDADDSGRIDITDSTNLLNWIFRGSVGFGPVPVFGECGVDVVDDDLPCERSVCL